MRKQLKHKLGLSKKKCIFIKVFLIIFFINILFPLNITFWGTKHIYPFSAESPLCNELMTWDPEFEARQTVIAEKAFIEHNGAVDVQRLEGQPGHSPSLATLV